MCSKVYYAVCISFEYDEDKSFICQKLSDVDSFIENILDSEDVRQIKSIVVDLVDFYEPSR